MADEMNKKLDRIFFGKTPELLKLFNEDALKAALCRQPLEYIDSMPNLIQINYITLIHDIYELTAGIIVNVDAIDITQQKRDSGIMMRAMFHEFIQDMQRTIFEKLNLTFFYRNLLVTFVRVYNFELIDNQTSFVNDLYQVEDYYTKVFEQQVADMPQVEQQQSKPLMFELSQDWIYGIDKLQVLSSNLWQAKFTESREAFANVFSVHSDELCNWKESLNALLFLLWNLLNDSDEIQPFIITMCVNKFTVKSKSITKKTAQTTSKRTPINIKLYELKSKFEQLNEMALSTKRQ